jgi:hypothetical protein
LILSTTQCWGQISAGGVVSQTLFIRLYFLSLCTSLVLIDSRYEGGDDYDSLDGAAGILAYKNIHTCISSESIALLTTD